MDRKFMEHYYDKIYEGYPHEAFIIDLTEYKRLNKAFSETNQKVLDAVGGMGSSAWNAVEDMLAIRYDIELYCMKLSYLQGAEGREKMLR